MYIHPCYVFAFEKFETKLFKSLIRKGMVVVDIGAYVGHYTLIAADLVGEKGKVFAFEPDPDNFALLLKNLEVNRCQNVIPVQKAIADRNGKTRLFLAQENKGDHRIYDSYDGRKSITVDVTSLDDFFKERDYRVDVIKMDIEGSEMAALNGMTKILKKNDDLKILTEFWPSGLRRFGTYPKKFLNKLREFGFELYHINEERKFIEPIDVTRATEMCKDEEHINIFCKKKNKKI
jgi:FkbM family methyltransferase